MNIKISSWQKIRIWYFGPYVVRKEKREGWDGKLSIYRFFCDGCGEFREDYPHGHMDRLDCPTCGHSIYLKGEFGKIWNTILFIMNEKIKRQKK